MMTGDAVFEYATNDAHSLVTNVPEPKDKSRVMPVYCFSNMFIRSELLGVDSRIQELNCLNTEYKSINKGNESTHIDSMVINRSSIPLKNSTEIIDVDIAEENRCNVTNKNKGKCLVDKIISPVHRTDSYHVSADKLFNEVLPHDETLHSSVKSSENNSSDDGDISSVNGSCSCNNISDDSSYERRFSICSVNEISCSFDSIDIFESTRNSDIKKSTCALNKLKDTESEGIYGTCSDNSGNGQKVKVDSNIKDTCSTTSSNETFVSVIEEYLYTDEDGEIFKEQRHLVNKMSVPVIIEDEIQNDFASLQSASSASSCMSLPPSFDYDSDALRKELRSSGVNPGPITSTTKRIYLKKLMKLKKKQQPIPNTEIKARVYRNELERTLKNLSWLNNLDSFIKLEREVATQFCNPDSSRRWRGGIAKTYFCYLLLDPRITINLPCRVKDLSPLEVWSTFLSAVFYIGKGVRSRPYAHLNEAAKVWRNERTLKDDKVQHIIDIWTEGMGVICLHVFQNVISVEAHTREAAMIEAIGLQNLRNARYSEYYGTVSTWKSSQKAKLGVYLLYCAMQIFLNEGERQLYPQNI